MYNFKKNAKAYIVTLDVSGNPLQRHQIDIYSDISASQTFDEQGYKRKTLHALTDVHQHAVITKASPANFSFTTPIPNAATTPIVLTLGGTYNTGTIESFDLYIESDNVIYRIQKAVISDMTFNIEKESVLTVSVSGTASRLSKFGNVGQVTIPGTVNTLTRSYTSIDRLSVSVNNTVLESIASVNIEVRNDIAWTANNTLNNSIAGTITYPANYVLQERTMSGSITQFLTSDNVDTLSDTSTSAPIVLSIFFTGYSSSTPLLQFNLPSTVFTRRLNLDELINRVYDFRLNSNSTNVKPIYKGV